MDEGTGHGRGVLLVGATGTVGRGIARSMAAAGWRVTAVGRDAERLAQVAQIAPDIATVAGSVASDADAATLAGVLRDSGAPFDAIVTAVNLPLAPVALLDCPADQLLDVLQGNLVSHLCAARALLPLLAAGGRYVGIGGGMADFTFPGLGPVSICQAAQRNMFRFLAMEGEERGASVVELMLYSNIVDPVDEDAASPRDIRADEVGEHVRAVIERPEEFAGPILALKSRKQVGQPQRD
jgi:NAD(P)-dependent dehydrogenase (short-subunit alcohol dehydrogenase family)